jgi:hypothetical protein
VNREILNDTKSLFRVCMCVLIPGRKLEGYIMNLVGVEEVTWDGTLECAD